MSQGLEEATGQKVVGVSVCWDFQEHEDELLEALRERLVGVGLDRCRLHSPHGFQCSFFELR